MGTPKKIGLITRREYEWLKKFPNLTQEESEKVEEFEKVEKSEYKPLLEKKTTKDPVQKIKITKGLIWKHFKIAYKVETGNTFVENPNTIKDIAPIINYFSRNDDFFKSDNLIKNKNNPSFDKGLLIIGMYGNGKTSIMKSLARLFKEYQMPMKYKAVNAHDIVTEYEGITDAGGKSLFYEKYTCKALYIDDVKKERHASNFGKVDLIRDILEKRYDKKLLTYITCNFREDDGVGNINDALAEFNMYGNHIYDRLFEMFNIIHFKGKTFRK